MLSVLSSCRGKAGVGASSSTAGMENIFLDSPDVSSLRPHWNSFTDKRWKTISSPRQQVRNVQLHISRFCSLVFLFINRYPCNKACQGSSAQLNVRHNLYLLQFCISRASKKTNHVSHELPPSFTDLSQHPILAAAGVS